MEPSRRAKTEKITSSSVKFELWKNQSKILHHDNAPAGTSMLMRGILAKNKIIIMPQPPYSLDLTPADTVLFQEL